MASVPERGPTVVGTNVTATVHVAPGARLPVQLSVAENSGLVSTPVTTNGASPELRTVRILAELDVPISWFPN